MLACGFFPTAMARFAGGPPGALESRAGRREGAAAGQVRHFGYFRNPVEIHGTAAITTMPTAIELR